MEPKELLTLFFERSSAMQTYWTFYITVAGALLAFFGSTRRGTGTALLMSAMFVGFAYVNRDGLLIFTRQKVEICEALLAKEGNGKTGSCGTGAAVPLKVPIRITLYPPSPEAVGGFHIGADIVILVAVWALALLPRERARGG